MGTCSTPGQPRDPCRLSQPDTLAPTARAVAVRSQVCIVLNDFVADAPVALAALSLLHRLSWYRPATEVMARTTVREYVGTL